MPEGWVERLKRPKYSFGLKVKVYLVLRNKGFKSFKSSGRRRLTPAQGPWLMLRNQEENGL